MTMTISRTDLARRTREAIEYAQRGQTVFIESYGAEQAAIMDARDYHLLRAAAVYRSQPLTPVNSPDATPRGLTDTDIENALEKHFSAKDVVSHILRPRIILYTTTSLAEKCFSSAFSVV